MLWTGFEPYPRCRRKGGSLTVFCKMQQPNTKSFLFEPSQCKVVRRNSFCMLNRAASLPVGYFSAGNKKTMWRYGHVCMHLMSPDSMTGRFPWKALCFWTFRPLDFGFMKALVHVCICIYSCRLEGFQFR